MSNIVGHITKPIWQIVFTPHTCILLELTFLTAEFFKFSVILDAATLGVPLGSGTPLKSDMKTTAGRTSVIHCKRVCIP